MPLKFPMPSPHICPPRTPSSTGSFICDCAGGVTIWAKIEDRSSPSSLVGAGARNGDSGQMQGMPLAGVLGVPSAPFMRLSLPPPPARDVLSSLLLRPEGRGQWAIGFEVCALVEAICDASRLLVLMTAPWLSTKDRFIACWVSGPTRAYTS